MIEVKNLTVNYQEKEILSNVSLSVKKGELLALVGPNGCGKSTLLKTIVGLKEKAAGEILIDGKTIESYKSKPKELSKVVSFLSQSRNIPEISGYSLALHGRFPYLSYPRRYRKEDYQIVEQALKRVGAENYAEKQVATLSGGERQNIYLAMLLAQDTGYVFMDEPTTYLDAAHQQKILRLANELTRETMKIKEDLEREENSGKGVVMVLHDLPEALTFADRIAVMEQGKLIQVGTPKEIYESRILDRVFGVEIQKTEEDQSYYLKYEPKE